MVSPNSVDASCERDTGGDESFKSVRVASWCACFKSRSSVRLASVDVGDKSELHLGLWELAGESDDRAGL